MAEEGDTKVRDGSLTDVLERIRAERFPHVDREIVREMLRLHADPDDGLNEGVDRLIFDYAGN